MEKKMIQDADLKKVAEPAKKAYTSPCLTEWGLLNDLTKGPGGTYFDLLAGSNPISNGHDL